MNCLLSAEDLERLFQSNLTGGWQDEEWLPFQSGDCEEAGGNDWLVRGWLVTNHHSRTGMEEKCPYLTLILVWLLTLCLL